VEQREYVLSKQVLKSGTALGALVREAKNAESKADFVHTLGVAQKECDETRYWLELFKVGNFIDEEAYGHLHGDATELLKIIRTIILRTKEQQALST